jgi:hypothetical protein
MPRSVFLTPFPAIDFGPFFLEGAMVFPKGVSTMSRVFKIRDGVITDEILLDVLGWLPAEKRIPLYNTKHRGGAIEHDGFLLTLDAKSAGELQSKAEW